MGLNKSWGCCDVTGSLTGVFSKGWIHSFLLNIYIVLPLLGTGDAIVPSSEVVGTSWRGHCKLRCELYSKSTGAVTGGVQGTVDIEQGTSIQSRVGGRRPAKN